MPFVIAGPLPGNDFAGQNTWQVGKRTASFDNGWRPILALVQSKLWWQGSRLLRPLPNPSKFWLKPPSLTGFRGAPILKCFPVRSTLFGNRVCFLQASAAFHRVSLFAVGATIAEGSFDLDSLPP